MSAAPGIQDCNCLAVRQAARHITQFYDRHLAAAGLRTTQYSILGILKKYGPMSINALAAELVMDRTTLGRNILPLERQGLVAIVPAREDRRSKEVHLTDFGAERFRQGAKDWAQAQAQFETAFGNARSVQLRSLLRAVSGTDFASAAGQVSL